MATFVEELERLVEASSIIFKATVSRLNASNEPTFPTSDRTVVAHVDEVFRAGPALGDLVGRSLTIELSRGHNLKVGDQAIYFANGRVYGVQIAVLEVGHLDPTERVARETAEAVRALPIRHLASRLATAELVVVGTVKQVRPSRIKEPRSFHSPDWKIAVIHRETSLKGKPDREVEVVFPFSHDQLWSSAPKFHEKQQGIFILHRGGRDWGLPAQANTALDSADFQPVDAQQRVRELIRHKTK